jgi:hypothetical protein
LNYREQALAHLLIVALGLAGLLLMFANCFNNSLSTGQKLALISILLFVGGHLIYLPFECIPRYGITSMPFLLLAAAFVIERIIASRKDIITVCTFALSLVDLQFQNMKQSPDTAI